MNDLFKIEFIDGEPYCRLDGVLLTDEYWEELCGIDGEVCLFDNGDIMYSNVYYSTDFKIDSILNNLGEWNNKPEPYDCISSKGMGYEKHASKEKIGDKYLIGKQNAEIKSISQFNIDYPNFKKDVYIKLMNSLDYYYENLKYKLN